MVGTVAPNLPSFFIDPATVTARNAEFAGTPLTDNDGGGTYADPYLGMNRGGSNAPGIGINTGDFDPKLDDWTLLDQGQGDAGATPLARTPQNSQHIGGEGLGGTLPSSGGSEGLTDVKPVNAVIAADFNDTMAFVQTAGEIAPGADLVAGVVNRTGLTVPSGANAWGTTTTA